MNPAAAANVGRGAPGPRFVSPKASDTYLSNEIIATIARQDLHETRCTAATAATSRCPLTLLRNLGDDALLTRLEKSDSTRYSHIPNPPQWYIRELHTNACGDFLPMSRTMWQTVRGFPLDDTVLSLDCDSFDHACRRGAGIARDLARRQPVASSRAATIRLFSNRVPLRLDAVAVEGRQDQRPTSAGGDCSRSRAAPSTIPSARSPAGACWRRRSSAISSNRPSNGRTASVRSSISRKLGLGGSAARGKAVVPGAVVGDGRVGGGMNVEQAGLGRRPRRPPLPC